MKKLSSSVCCLYVSSARCERSWSISLCSFSTMESTNHTGESSFRIRDRYSVTKLSDKLVFTFKLDRFSSIISTWIACRGFTKSIFFLLYPYIWHKWRLKIVLTYKSNRSFTELIKSSSETLLAYWHNSQHVLYLSWNVLIFEESYDVFLYVFDMSHMAFSVWSRQCKPRRRWNCDSLNVAVAAHHKCYWLGA